MQTNLGINNYAIKKFLAKIQGLLPILKELKNQDVNISVFCVGGATRDLLLGSEVKDVDIEVHNTTMDKLDLILKKFTKTCMVGKRFLVIKTPKLNCDWAMARTDGIGRLPEVNPIVSGSYKIAAQRRDLTINSIGIDLIALASKFDQLQALSVDRQEHSWVEQLPIIDPFNGVADIAQKRLRAVDKEFFGQDPLRLFRVAQFYSRLGFAPDQELTEICKYMPIELADPNDVYYCPSERIGEELFKLLVSQKPSLGLKWLIELGRTSELLPGVEVFGQSSEKQFFEEKLRFLDGLSALGKTNLSFDGKKIIDQTNHRFYALALLLYQVLTAENFLKFIKVDVQVINKILKLYRLISCFIESQFLSNFGVQVKLLAKSSWPELTCLEIFTFYSLSRCGLGSSVLVKSLSEQGDNSIAHQSVIKVLKNELEESVEALLALAKRAADFGVLLRPIPALISGYDALELGFQGESIKQLLEKAYNLQIAENITDKKELIEKLK